MPAPWRAGEDAPDPAYVNTSPADAIKRAETDAATRDLADCSEEVVRVSDDQHMATRPGPRNFSTNHRNLTRRPRYFSDPHRAAPVAAYDKDHKGAIRPSRWLTVVVLAGLVLW